MAKRLTGCALTVLNALRTCERFGRLGVSQQQRVVVRYDRTVARDYTADRLVEDIVLDL